MSSRSARIPSSSAAPSTCRKRRAPWPLRVALATLARRHRCWSRWSARFSSSSVQQAAETLGIAPAFVGFIIVALVGDAPAEDGFGAVRCPQGPTGPERRHGAGQRFARSALFVAPVLVLASYVLGPTPMSLQFWPGAVAMMLIATLVASLVTNTGRSSAVRRRNGIDRLSDFRHDAVSAPASRPVTE